MWFTPLTSPSYRPEFDLHVNRPEPESFRSSESELATELLKPGPGPCGSGPALSPSPSTRPATTRPPINMKASSIFVALQCAALATSAPVFLSSPIDTKSDTPSRPQWHFKPPTISTETVFRDTRRPTSTIYLTSFTHRLPKSNSEMAVDGRRPSGGQRLDMDGVITITGVDAVVSIPVSSNRLDVPCHLARLSREREDVTVVVLSLVFFLIVLAVESWGFVCQR